MKRISLLLVTPFLLVGCDTMNSVFGDSSAHRPDYISQDQGYEHEQYSRQQRAPQRHEQKQHQSKQHEQQPQRSSAASSSAQKQSMPATRGTEAVAERKVVAPAAKPAKAVPLDSPSGPNMAPMVGQ